MGARLFSLMASLLAILLMEGLLLRQNVGSNVRSASILVGLLTSLSILQVQAGATARMYGLGVLFMALTAWLLLRALNGPCGPSGWWLGYGAALAAFAHTHYFVFFAALAQALFVAVTSAWRCRTEPWRQVAPAAASFLGSIALAFLLFAPWLPVFLAQRRAVQEGWWVSAPNLETVEHMLFSWMTGMAYPGPIEARFVLMVLAGLIAWTVWRGGLAGWFFFLQAFVPWAAVLLIAQTGGPSLLQDRYLVFAQVSLFGLWGVTWQVLPNFPSRILVAGFLLSMCLTGLGQYLAALPTQPAASAVAADWLKDHAQADDLFLLQDYREINRFRYYTTVASLPWLDVRARLSPFQKGHVVHVASLEGREIYWSEDELWPAAPRRVWRVSQEPAWPHTPVPGRKPTLARTFTSGPTMVTLVLHEPAQ